MLGKKLSYVALVQTFFLFFLNCNKNATATDEAIIHLSVIVNASRAEV